MNADQYLAIIGNKTNSDTLVQWDILYLFDWVFSLLLFVATLPICLAAFAWVILLDPGNPMYCQHRVGLGLKPFKLYKIRTMRQYHGPEAYCVEQDSRILPGASFLRFMRIDELPQLINVLKGEMALIGPRPEQLPFVLNYLDNLPNYHLRFTVRPGLTGLAQVRQGYATCTYETRRKLRYDLKYIEKRGFPLWLQIALLTVRVICTGRGAR